MQTKMDMSFGKLAFIILLRSIARLVVEGMVPLAVIMPRLGILGH